METNKTKKGLKDFDAVAYMREQRDRISREIANMTHEQILEYCAKKRRKRPAAQPIKKAESKRAR